jgi:hypothetical protein
MPPAAGAEAGAAGAAGAFWRGDLLGSAIKSFGGKSFGGKFFGGK